MHRNSQHLQIDSGVSYCLRLAAANKLRNVAPLPTRADRGLRSQDADVAIRGFGRWTQCKGHALLQNQQPTRQISQFLQKRIAAVEAL